MSVEHLKAIREYEIKHIFPCFRIGEQILEIGSGMGWQAQLMRQHRLKVTTLDLPENTIGSPQIVYDGRQLPFRSRSIDTVYTSNVLEHIEHLHDFQKEVWRVLKAGGRVIHVLPSTSWRWWTSFAFYIRKLQAIPRKLTLLPFRNQEFPTTTIYRKQRLVPEKHGSSGNSLTELYTFSRHYWVQSFQSFGWMIEMIHPNYLFYTGYSLFDKHLSLSVRHYLSYFLGSACTIYVLIKR